MLSFTSVALEKECVRGNCRKIMADGGRTCAHYGAFQKVRDQPGGPWQLTATVCLSLVRTVMVLAAARDGKWS